MRRINPAVLELLNGPCPSCSQTGNLHTLDLGWDYMPGDGGDNLLRCDSCSFWEDYGEPLTPNQILKMAEQERRTPSNMLRALHARRAGKTRP